MNECLRGIVDMSVCRVHQAYNRLVDQLHIVQNCQLGLMHASQIDWASDGKLCKLVCKLGEPITEHIE